MTHNTIVHTIVLAACDYAGCDPQVIYCRGKSTTSVTRVRRLVYRVAREHRGLSGMSKRELAAAMSRTASWVRAIESSPVDHESTDWWQHGIAHVKERIQ